MYGENRSGRMRPPPLEPSVALPYRATEGYAENGCGGRTRTPPLGPSVKLLVPTKRVRGVPTW
eukprot:2061872-Pyramimonas_sp.AAC.1